MRSLRATPELRRRGRKSGPAALPVFIAVLVICGIFSYLHKSSETADSGEAPFSPIRQYFLTPISKGAVGTRNWFERSVASVTQGPRFAHQNVQLQEQVAILTEQYRELGAEADENRRLRSLLDFKVHSPLKLLPAEVIATKPTQARETITLQRGAKDHVARLMPVIAGDGGLVGQVVSVTYDTCDVLLLTDDESGVAGMVYPILPTDKLGLGICQGERTSMLNFVDLPTDADLTNGQEVFTSGQGGVYPKGLLIGEIQSSQTVPAMALRTATVKPAVDFDHLQDVFIILKAPVPLPASPNQPTGVSSQ